MKIKHKAFFLDRDGVINRRPPEHDYVKSWEEFELLPTVPEAIKLLKDKGWLVVVVSNQRGVARGLVSKSTVDRIHVNLNKTLKKYGTFIDGFYCCIHGLTDNCSCRKPAPGLVFKAAQELDIDTSQSWLVGDSDRDILCGRSAGVKTIKMQTNGCLIDILKETGQF